MGSVGIVETKNFHIEEKIQLESGIEFGPIDVAYETYGTLNENKDNATSCSTHLQATLMQPENTPKTTKKSAGGTIW